MPRIRFWFDYVDPASYLLERVLAEAEEELGLTLERTPFEVTPPPLPLVDTHTERWRCFWEGARSAASAAGVSLAEPRLVPWTRKAHELALHARELERFADVHRALFETFLVAGKDVGRVDVLLEVAALHGLDLSRARAVLDVDRHAPEVERARAEAERLGVRGVPTLLAEHGRLEGFRGRDLTLAFLERSAAR